MKISAILGVACFATVSSAGAAGLSDAQARQLAQASGCVACHTVEPVKPAAGAAAPIGPAWQDVARKYAGNAHARHLLVPIVMNGSSPYESHWKGKVSGYAMPPNHVAISESDAGALVDWILALSH